MVPTVALAVMSILSTSGSAQGDPPALPRRSLETVACPRFAVEDSGVNGPSQVVERAEGGAHLVLSVHGIAGCAPHAAVAYVGSCGPDRPWLLAHEPIGRTHDPFVA